VVANDEYCILESDDFGRFTSLLSNELPVTYTVQARPNRPHLYFRQTEASKAAGNLDSPGVFEFKQNNRYVVGEGSIHPTGVPYSETNPSDIVPIPDWLVTDLQAIRSGRTTKVSAPLPSPGEKLGEGEGRHPMLMSAAARLWDGQKTRDDMLEDLESVNQAHCDPPKSPPHLLSCIDWVMAREPNQAAPAVEIGSVWGITVPAALDYVKEHKIDRAPLLVQGTRGVVLYEKSLNQIVAERGLGKTLFALGLAGCLSTGTSILDYQATKACRVVFVDGELPFEQLCERAASFCLSDNVFLINPEQITPKGPIRLLKRESKFAYAETPAVDKLKRALKHHKADVLILDSQSTLMGTDSLSMEFQETRMNFLRDLRTEGYCVIEMHHTGKQGLQRGSSVNDDILDLQFILKRCDDWSPGQKLQFELTIGKLRHAADLEEEFVVTLDAEW
jgi:hypothetical protein